jgi:hypothetical protein
MLTGEIPASLSLHPRQMYRIPTLDEADQLANSINRHDPARCLESAERSIMCPRAYDKFIPASDRTPMLFRRQAAKVQC